jgi:hypothetical protein
MVIRLKPRQALLPVGTVVMDFYRIRKLVTDAAPAAKHALAGLAALVAIASNSTLLVLGFSPFSLYGFALTIHLIFILLLSEESIEFPSLRR